MKDRMRPGNRLDRGTFSFLFPFHLAMHDSRYTYLRRDPMRRSVVLVLLVLVLLPILASAQQRWQRLNGPNQGQVGRLYGIGKYLLASTANGISRSPDDGSTWGIAAA